MATKVKTPARPLPQTREEVQQLIAELGRVQRSSAVTTAAMNDEIAKITASNAATLDAHTSREKELLDDIAAWCEANKDTLTVDGKTVNLITGEIAWRLNPPSVSFKKGIKVEQIVAHIKQLKFAKLFVRVKEEVDKEAILKADAKTLSKLTAAGTIKIVRDAETFSVTPFEQEA